MAPPDPALDSETVAGIIRKLMEIDVKLDLVLDHLEADDEEDDA